MQHLTNARSNSTVIPSRLVHIQACIANERRHSYEGTSLSRPDLSGNTINLRSISRTKYHRES